MLLSHEHIINDASLSREPLGVSIRGLRESVLSMRAMMVERRAISQERLTISRHLLASIRSTETISR
jgi:hypothetical protein